MLDVDTAAVLLLAASSRNSLRELRPASRKRFGRVSGCRSARVSQVGCRNEATPVARHVDATTVAESNLVGQGHQGDARRAVVERRRGRRRPPRGAHRDTDHLVTTTSSSSRLSPNGSQPRSRWALAIERGATLARTELVTVETAEMPRPDVRGSYVPPRSDGRRRLVRPIRASVRTVVDRCR